MIDSIVLALGVYGIMFFPFDAFMANLEYYRYDSFRSVLGYELRFYHNRAWRFIFYCFADLACIVVSSFLLNK